MASMVINRKANGLMREHLNTDLSLSLLFVLLNPALLSSELNSSYSGRGKPLPDGLTKSSAYSHIPARKSLSITSCCPRLLRHSAPVPHGAYTSVYRNSFTTLAASRTLSHHVQPSTWAPNRLRIYILPEIYIWKPFFPCFVVLQYTSCEWECVDM